MGQESNVRNPDTDFWKMSDQEPYIEKRSDPDFMIRVISWSGCGCFGRIWSGHQEKKHIWMNIKSSRIDYFFIISFKKCDFNLCITNPLSLYFWIHLNLKPFTYLSDWRRRGAVEWGSHAPGVQALELDTEEHEQIILTLILLYIGKGRIQQLPLTPQMFTLWGSVARGQQ